MLNPSWPGKLLMPNSDGGGSKAVYAYSNIKPFFDAMSTSRVAIVNMGDSNQLYQGGGNDDGLYQALAYAGYPCYATHIHPGNENGYLGSGIGSVSGQLNNGSYAAWGTNVISNAGLNTYNLNHDGNAVAMGALEIHTTPVGAVQNGIGCGSLFNGPCQAPGGLIPINLQHNLKVKIWYGRTTAAGSGKFNPHARRGESPFTSYIATNIEIPTESQADESIQLWSTTISAGTVASGASMQLSPMKISSGSTTVAKAWIFYSQIVDTDATTGFAMHNYYSIGGMSAWDMCDFMNTREANAQQLFIDAFTDEMSANGKTLIVINTGLNDRNETQPSCGPNAGITPGDSAAAYYDNMEGIIINWQTQWANAGRNTDDLYFLICPSHPISNPNDAELESYKASARALADIYPTVAVWDMALLATYDDYVSRGWYEAAGTDLNHCRAPAYVGEARMLLQDIGKGPAVEFPTLPVSEGNYLSRASNLTTLVSDFQSGTASMVIYPTRAVNDTDYFIRMQTAGAATVLEWYMTNLNNVFLDIYNAASTRVVRVNTQGWMGGLYSNTRTHLLFSWNTNPSTVSVAINDSLTGYTSSVTASGVPNLTGVASMAIGANVAGASPWDGGIGEFWMKFGAYTDFTAVANRRLFNDSLGNPKVLPADGIVGGMTPDIYFRAADFSTGVNRGAGGDFAVNGVSVVTNRQ